jgi:hypothetical protein
LIQLSLLGIYIIVRKRGLVCIPSYGDYLLDEVLMVTIGFSPSLEDLKGTPILELIALYKELMNCCLYAQALDILVKVRAVCSIYLMKGGSAPW